MLYSAMRKAAITTNSPLARTHKSGASFFKSSIAAIDFPAVGDVQKYDSREELKQSAGTQTRNPWLFKNANIDDVIFANNGVDTCIGIGIIDGEYRSCLVFFSIHLFFHTDTSTTLSTVEV